MLIWVVVPRDAARLHLPDREPAGLTCSAPSDSRPRQFRGTFKFRFGTILMRNDVRELRDCFAGRICTCGAADIGWACPHPPRTRRAFRWSAFVCGASADPKYVRTIYPFRCHPHLACKPQKMSLLAC